jgi:hypothetical protein
VWGGVDSSGHLGTASPGAVLDETADGQGGEAIRLEPVTFHYSKLDPDGIPQFGLVAEQVEKVNPDLVTRDADGKV